MSTALVNHVQETAFSRHWPSGNNLYKPWHSRMIVLLTHEPLSDFAINKLSALGQIDDIKAWCSEEAQPAVETYYLITFRYVEDAQRVLLPRSDAITRLVAHQQSDDLHFPSPPTLGIIRHHPLPRPDAVVPPAATEGMTRSVIFFDSNSREIRLTPRFQEAIDLAWRRVREVIDLEGNVPLEQSLLGRTVPEPWRSKRWLLFTGFDTRRGRTTFESVDVARRVIRKMLKPNWGGEWNVAEGRYVNDPVDQEDDEDETMQVGDGNSIGDIQIVKEYGVSMSVWP